MLTKPTTCIQYVTASFLCCVNARIRLLLLDTGIVRGASTTDRGNTGRWTKCHCQWPVLCPATAACVSSFVHWLKHLFIHLVSHSFTHSFIPLFTYSLIQFHSFTNTFCLFVHSHSHSLMPFFHSLACSDLPLDPCRNLWMKLNTSDAPHYHPREAELWFDLWPFDNLCTSLW